MTRSNTYYVIIINKQIMLATNNIFNTSIVGWKLGVMTKMVLTFCQVFGTTFLNSTVCLVMRFVDIFVGRWRCCVCCGDSYWFLTF